MSDTTDLRALAREVLRPTSGVLPTGEEETRWYGAVFALARAVLAAEEQPVDREGLGRLCWDAWWAMYQQPGEVGDWPMLPMERREMWCRAAEAVAAAVRAPSEPAALAILQETIESFERKARELRAIQAQHEAHLDGLDGRAASECRSEAYRLADKASTYEYEARAMLRLQDVAPSAPLSRPPLPSRRSRTATDRKLSGNFRRRFPARPSPPRRQAGRPVPPSEPPPRWAMRGSGRGRRSAAPSVSPRKRGTAEGGSCRWPTG